ncbi:hypothetical protein GCM10023168_25970 [Fodinibacter luteus]|uniref:LysM domain-containing protein n=1 Tax=Fodinibacter luteus TaxID=552064 RepID=A0ABP8KKW1_9MICO
MNSTVNSIKRSRIAFRSALALTVACLFASWLWRVVAGVADRLSLGAPPDAAELVTGVAAAAALAGLGWLALGIVLELVALVPGSVGRGARSVTEALTPRLVRRSLGALLGLGVVAGLAPGTSLAAPAPAKAVATAPLPDPGFRPLPDPGWSTPDAVTPATGWVPAVPPVRPQPDVRVLSGAPRETDLAPADVVVTRGDSLWSIASRHLGPGATDAEVAEAWPAWFEANRHVIGADPDLLLPGQVLRAPDPASAS